MNIESRDLAAVFPEKSRTYTDSRQKNPALN